MREMIKCYACQEHGVVIMGDLFTVRRCDHCFGKGWRYIYYGEFAKEEKRLDDLREQEILHEKALWQEASKERNYE